LRSGAPKATRVITAELDPELAHGVMDMFADDDIDVMHADWSSLADTRPFSLIFMDAASAKAGRGRQITELLDNGGMIVLDDFIPCPTWPRWRAAGWTRCGWTGCRRALHQRRRDGRRGHLGDHRGQEVAIGFGHRDRIDARPL
jgi:hypothetical protein